MSALSTQPGFANPAEDSQAVFRAVLEAFSRPGIPVALPVLPPPLPCGGLCPGMLALALALCDGDTPLWLDAAADTPEARHHLRFHCASPLTVNPLDASFAFVARPEAMPRLQAFHPGRADFPDRSATLVIRAALSSSHAHALELTGPGVRGNDRDAWQAFGLSGLPAWFWEDWGTNHAAYPLGVDVLFVESGAAASGTQQARLLGLPRTARVRPVQKSRSDSLALKEGRACMSL